MVQQAFLACPRLGEARAIRPLCARDVPVLQDRGSLSSGRCFGEAMAGCPSPTVCRRVPLVGLLLVHAATSAGQISAGREHHIVLVTGANRGLGPAPSHPLPIFIPPTASLTVSLAAGLEVARGFGELGHSVILTSRNPVAGARATDDLRVCLLLDREEDSSSD